MLAEQGDAWRQARQKVFFCSAPTPRMGKPDSRGRWMGPGTKPRARRRGMTDRGSQGADHGVVAGHVDVPVVQQKGVRQAG